MTRKYAESSGGEQDNIASFRPRTAAGKLISATALLPASEKLLAGSHLKLPKTQLHEHSPSDSFRVYR
jgi:hypothetical protein